MLATHPSVPVLHRLGPRVSVDYHNAYIKVKVEMSQH